MKNKFLLLVAALVLSTTTTFAASQSIASIPTSTVSDPNSSKAEDMLVVVRTYMEGHGILVAFVEAESGTPNYLVKDIDGNWYRVYVQESCIIGYDEFSY